MLKSVLKRLLEASVCKKVLRRLARFAAMQDGRENLRGQLQFCDDLRRVCAERLGLGTGGAFDASGEAGALQFVAMQLPGAGVVFDVGANRGEYACLLAEIFPQSSIYAFEPSPATFGLLQEKTAGLKQVRTFNSGLSNAEGELQLFSNREGSGLASVHRRRLDHFGIQFDKSETVRMRTLDGFCDEQGIERIDFLKLDVEGHELEVLKGALRRLNSDRISAIQFEFGGCNIDSRTFFQDFYYLLSERYRICRILREGLFLVDRYKEEDEVFITTNYLALHKERFSRVGETGIIGFDSLRD